MTAYLGAWRAQDGPVVRAEGRGGQALLVVQIAGVRIIRPGIADGGRLRDLVAGDQQAVAVNAGVGPNELLVRARDGEAGQFAPALGRQPAADMLEAQADATAFDGHRIVDRAGRSNSRRHRRLLRSGPGRAR